MAVVAVLCPSFVSILILYMKNKEQKLFNARTLAVYFANVSINTILTILTVCMLIRSDVGIDSFSSIMFFAKYEIIAIVYAVIVPILYLILKSYIKISLVVEEYEANEN